MFRWLKRDRQTKAQAQALYGAIMSQARCPSFYQALGVPDTFDGRFDLLVLLTHLVLRRLRALGEPAKPLSQALFDSLFDDMDQVLREIGVTDTGVGKKIRDMAQAFYGRALAYDTALQDADGGALAQALARNVLGDPAKAALAQGLAAYALRTDRALSQCALGALQAGTVPFPAPLDAAA